ncbi:hypothetical protein BDZ91DRAFT_720184 [Kalaharituber pfeilii]|nr:hypothetical protein BDZ91DRAFT_720184 [Kalaharituber pfeilii]
MTSSPKLMPLPSPSHYSNRAREKRCTRAKELLVELIKSQTTHDVDPKDVKTTKPSSGVSWRFVVDPGTEFPLVQLSSISRPNLDLLEKAVEGGGVKVVWLNEQDVNRSSTEDETAFQDSRRPRKRIRHSAEPATPSRGITGLSTSTHASSEGTASLSQRPSGPPAQSAQQPTPPAPVTLPSAASFTTVNEASRHHVNPAPTQTSPPSITSSTENHDAKSQSTITVDIPISAIAKVLDKERNSIMEQLRRENQALSEENKRMQVEIANIQSKYNALEDQLRKKMHQMQEILEGKSTVRELNE